ncbi:DUF928 domain-containing protein [Geitlerinema sp. PCC 9228]|jgi:hypothetical protein|uniref:DUF928 domain-containing protein n=1 Tax=Geitlerinema sp. PCC 9228 TaxID=111611 RepID=UPI0008F9CB2E|nr:DUF928 domain-containing protein [Geitlerinema sp. PCC 9228]
MKARKLPIYLSTIVLAGTMGIGNFPQAGSSARAQTTAANSLEKATQIHFDLPPTEGGPQQTAGGGTRGGCEAPTASNNGSANMTTVALLLPQNKTGMTVSERPTFFAYLSQTSAQKVEFTIRNASETYTYRQTLEVGETPGIISFSLPETAPPLQVGEQYRWSVAAICEPEDRLQDIVAFGRLQRVEESDQLQRQLAAAETPLAKAQAYAENGIWHETTEIVAQLKRQQPNNQAVQDTWVHLLQQDTVALGDIAQQPLLDCCIAPENQQTSRFEPASALSVLEGSPASSQPQ